MAESVFFLSLPISTLPESLNNEKNRYDCNISLSYFCFFYSQDLFWAKIPHF
jgi:hypothetical protein